VKTHKHERGGQVKVRIHILVYGDNSRTVALKEKTFAAVTAVLNMAMLRSFEVLLGQTLNPSVWNFAILCNVIPW
jgi:hypothetical protein